MDVTGKFETSMPSCGELLDRLGPQQHVVQLYGTDDALLTQNVYRFLSEGLRRGDGVLVIATPEHRTTLAAELREEAGYSKAVLEGRIVFLDAAATLARFMVQGSPDRGLFQSIIGETVRRVRSRAVHTGVRAYGEMVGLLWRAGEHAAAAELEKLWNELLRQSDVCLFCAYPIDIFGPEFEAGHIDAVLCTHSHLLPFDEALEQALHRAMDEVLEAPGEVRSSMLSHQSPSWGSVPRAEAIVLWLRTNFPRSAEQVLARAREHYLATARA